MSSQQLIKFFEGTGPDDQGRMIYTINTQSDDWWEESHDFIQWVFPNREVSFFNPKAPLLDDAFVDAFAKSNAMQRNSEDAFFRFIKFLKVSDDYAWWIEPGNHNMLRITRVLHFLRETNQQYRVDALFARLEQLHKLHPVVLGKAFGFWKDTKDGNV